MLAVVSNRGRMSNHYFSDTAFESSIHFACTHPEHRLHSSTGVVARTNGTGVLCSRAWIRMYGFVVTSRISSAAAN